MPLQAFRSVPKDILEWARYFTSLVITPDTGTITDDTFANRTPNSIIGRPGSTPGAPSDITASADRQFLVRRTSTLQFDGIEVADLPSGVATADEVATAANAAQAAAIAASAASLAAHVADSDAHPVYLTQAEGDARYRELTDAVTYTELTGKPAALGLMFSGTGSPETVVAASVGALYLRTDGGAGTTLYVKESGAGNTGWIGK